MHESIDYSMFVKRLAKPGSKIREELTDQDAHLSHMALGLADECGELISAIKKSVIYRKPIDLANVIEELGDLSWYMQGVMNELGLTWEQVFEANKVKLMERYKKGYSDKAAQDREDKAVGALPIEKGVYISGGKCSGSHTLGAVCKTCGRNPTLNWDYLDSVTIESDSCEVCLKIDSVPKFLCDRHYKTFSQHMEDEKNKVGMYSWDKVG